MRARARLMPWLLALGSSALLVLSYPWPDWGWLAWGALAPLLVALEGQSPRRAFLLGYLCGVMFFLGLTWWLIYVTVIGWIVLCVYLALYVGVFGWLTSRVSLAPCPLSLVLLPAAWVALEWARSHVLTGFGWGLLGYTQWRWLPVMQMADVCGAYGVSAAVVAVNVAAWSLLRRRSQARITAFAASLVMTVVLGYGAWRLHQRIDGQPLRVAVAQGNIPQSQKWEPSLQGDILTTYARLTRQAAAQHPDLIVWPETAVPGFLGLEPEVTDPVLTLVGEAGVPCLIGSPTEFLRVDRFVAYNSAVLVTPEGGLEQRYDKLHLVPYGEFLPFESWVPWLRRLLPPMGDFLPGDAATVFTVRAADGGTARLSTLICFEDVFPQLTRRFTRAGAGLLAVITNDAWFNDSPAAVQHAQASVFRAVENRVSVVRAANTGVSCFIDPWGRLTGAVQDAAGRRVGVAGVSTQDVVVTRGGSAYRTVGDLFAAACLALTLAALWRARARR